MTTKYANRGKFLEDVIQRSNITYKHKGIAMIDKVATPINFNTRTGKAFHKEKSTVDYVGCMAHGPFVAFDAKETKINRLPFDKVSDHQVDYLKITARMGHVAFLLVHFTTARECYRLTIDEYMQFQRDHDRKSIPLEWFRTHATTIQSGHGLPLDYLKHINGV